MSWDRIELDVAAAGEGLAARIEGLFAQQRATWPTLREGEAALQHLQVKRLEVDGASIVVQANPARRNSVHASVDAQSIAARACFLCPENMPPEERGVAFEDLLVLPNPYPILPMHCTVADRAHRQQRLAGRVGQLVRLAAAAGPELAVFYNGPRSGASAPDHLHFQACRAAGIPLLEELSGAAADSRGV
ncbi:MAG: DUF4922 domain-containing protein, partial [Pirellulales bacterium]|nr:DUF4922 domain-containing protein [Pirellulales bacterium]